MSYQTELEKIEQPLSAELYRIFNNSTYQYVTSYPTPIVYGGFTYNPTTIKRTGFSLERSLKVIEVSITAPIEKLFQEYIASAPYSKTIVDIIKVFVSSPDTLNQLIFTGSVATVSLKNGIATALCKSRNSLLARKIPRIIYQTNCNYSLFDNGCGINPSSYERFAHVFSISNNDLVMTGITGIPDGYYQGGMIFFGNEARLVTTHVGTTITLLIQFADIEVGDSVTLYPGCNGTPAACASFGNQDRFMGMPNIPTKNAILWGFR